MRIWQSLTSRPSSDHAAYLQNRQHLLHPFIPTNKECRICRCTEILGLSLSPGENTPSSLNRPCSVISSQGLESLSWHSQAMRVGVLRP
ncbi:uncharacterized protein ARMOST_00964 [Armillaria ostoyae]|uniref:Uncharacterized protein n=1 Tax=Armillaria ostoyae TaxID=47428 RepID=A0A284QMM6_ARMOS|nr:uncharacterized protein ARMOST_00964 [Armillaria ostoyae]